MQTKVLDALASLAQENYKEAAIKLTNVTIIDEPSISSIVTPRDLAFYVIISALKSMSRAEIKSEILSASGFKNLMEMAGSPSTEDVIENFLNGRYMDFQRQIVQITSHLKYDLYFGRRLNQVTSDIRRKALVQYVSPYKVIDMREIAKAFDLSVERVEQEIAQLIISKQIQSKIDSHSKVSLISLIYSLALIFT